MNGHGLCVHFTSFHISCKISTNRDHRPAGSYFYRQAIFTDKSLQRLQTSHRQCGPTGPSSGTDLNNNLNLQTWSCLDGNVNEHYTSSHSQVHDHVYFVEHVTEPVFKGEVSYLHHFVHYQHTKPNQVYDLKENREGVNTWTIYRDLGGKSENIKIKATA